MVRLFVPGASNYELTTKWFETGIFKYHGLQAFSDSFMLSSLRHHYRFAFDDHFYLVAKPLPWSWRSEAVSMLAMAVPGTTSVGYILAVSRGGVMHTGFP